MLDAILGIDNSDDHSVCGGLAPRSSGPGSVRRLLGVRPSKLQREDMLSVSEAELRLRKSIRWYTINTLIFIAFPLCEDIHASFARSSNAWATTACISLQRF